MDTPKCKIKKSYIIVATGIIIISAFLLGCTISINLADTHGTASDVVDSTPSTHAETDAEVSIPAIH